MKRFCVVVAVGVSVVGCATKPVANGPTKYLTTGACAKTWAELRVDALPTPDKNGQPIPLTIDANVPCLSTDQYYEEPALLFSISNLKVPAEVVVDSLGSQPATFAPSVAVLDRAYREITRINFAQFSKRGANYSVSIFLNKKEPMPAYLLIMADMESLGQSNVHVAGVSDNMYVSTGTVAFTIVNGHEVTTRSVLSDLGRISISVKGESPSAASKH